ncbi:MAG: glycerophosphodiester phosphodiesterase family protein [Gammaproteobacteria bacterium]|nr:glycerophosphodiester phosphodiesterase family protein [Gammaproteobacteria bacterium]
MVSQLDTKPALVAHRGYAKNYPENSLKAFSAAINCGGKYIELDVQLTRDHVPCVIHDEDLLRTGGDEISVLDSDWVDLKSRTIGENIKFGGKFPAERLTSLKDFVSFLHKNKDVTAFVELKEESIHRFGSEIVLNRVLSELSLVQDQCVIISFDHAILTELKKISELPIGFVVHGYDKAHHELASQLQPNFIICNYKKIPDEDNALWHGDWEWMLYEVTDPEIAFKWFSRGVKYIETMAFSEMITAINAK